MTTFDLAILPDLATVGARVYSDAQIPVSHDTATVLTFNQERFDSDAFHEGVTNPSRLTVPVGKAGTYMIGGNAQWTSDPTATRLFYIQRNGTDVIASLGTPAVVGGGLTYSNVNTVYELAEGDYVELVAYQNSGSPLGIDASANHSPEFWCVRVGL